MKTKNLHESLRRKGLFIAFEGIEATIFDSQVALHVRHMRDHDVEMEIWSFETRKRHYSKSLQQLQKSRKIAQSSIRLFRGVFRYLPFSGLLNALNVWFQLRKYGSQIDFIHARADYAAHVCAYIAPLLKIPVIWDCRGDSVAEFDLAFSPANILLRLAKRVFIILARYRTWHAAKNCQAAIFVSKGLRKSKARMMSDNNVVIIPCSVSSKLFFFSEELRQVTRQKLGFTDQDRVLIYSGGMVKYQGFGEYVKMFSSLYQQNPKYKFLIVSPYVEKALGHLHNLAPERYMLISATLNEMNTFYNAADFGTLLRPRNAVNRVASPTKFGEYCLSGLPVIMNDTVEQSWQFSKILGNCIHYENGFPSGLPLPSDALRRKAVAESALPLISRKYLTSRYLSLYKGVIQG